MLDLLVDNDFTNHKQTVKVSRTIIHSMNQVFGMDKLDYRCDILVFIEVLKKTQQDLISLSNDMNGKIPDFYKQYAIFAYWIKRLKPFNERYTEYENYTNETLALTYALVRVNGLVPKNMRKTNFPLPLLRNTLYFIRFEQISKYGILLFLTAVFEV